MIQKKILSDLHKKIFTNPEPNRFLTAFFHNIPTFSFLFCRKKLPFGGDVTQGNRSRKRCYENRSPRFFHREEGVLKQSKYLLKTKSFPHSPQLSPQGFSTARGALWRKLRINIKIPDIFRPTSHFFGGRVFYHNKFFVQKFGLDKNARGRRLGVGSTG